MSTTNVQKRCFLDAKRNILVKDGCQNRHGEEGGEGICRVLGGNQFKEDEDAERIKGKELGSVFGAPEVQFPFLPSFVEE